MRSLAKTLPLLALAAGVAFAGGEKRPLDKLEIKPLRAFEPPAAKPVTLANGIQGYILEDHELPLVEVEVILRAGSVWDPADEVGLAAVAGATWRKGGTRTHPKEKLDEILEKHGATLEAGIGNDQGSVHLSCLKEDLELGLSLMKELLTEPLFPEDKLAETKESFLSAIESRNDTGPPIASRIFSMQVYGKKSPLARETTKESIEKITAEDLAAWHKKFVRPESSLLGAFGDQTAGEFEKKLGKAFGDWKGSGEAPRPEMPLVECSKKAAWILIDKPDVNQSAIHIGHVGAVRSPARIPDYAKVLVMNAILGGGGFSSRLMLHVRSDQSLAYSVGSTFGWEYDHPGTFRMMCETKSETTVKAIKSLLHELDEIRTKECTDEELAVAKESLLNEMPFWVDTPEKILDNTLRYAYRGFPQDTVKRLAEAVSKVTKADVLEIAKSSWDPSALIVVVCGNKAEFGSEQLDSVAKTGIEVVADPEAWAVGKAGKAPGKSEKSSEKPEKAEKPASSGLLDKLIAASGGKKAIEDLKVLRLEQVTTEDDAERKEEILFQIPDKLHWEMSGKGAPKRTIVVDGAKAVIVIAGSPPANLPADQLAQVKSQFAGMTAAVLKAAVKGDAEVVSEDDATWAGKPAKKLVLEVKGTRKQTFFLDPESGALLGKETATGEGKVRAYVDETKEVGGVKLPTKLSVREGEKADSKRLATIVISKIEANPKLADDAFRLPEVKDDDEGDK